MLKMKSLHDELKEAGLFERCEVRCWSKFTLILSVVAGLLVAHAHIPLWGSLLLLPVTGWFCAVLAMFGHEGSHRSLSKSAFRNRLMHYLAFPMFGGVAANYWHWKHDTKHHVHPNVAEHDPDILLWPMAATAIEYRRSAPARQWFQRNLQGAMFWPLCFMLVWSMRGSGVAFLYRYARDRGMDRHWWADTGSLAVHLAAWVIVPTIFFGPWAIALYAGIWTMVGGALSAIFAPGHIGMPIVNKPEDIWRLQFETSRNLKMPAWLSFFFIGLNYQVEHHLYPRIPHSNLGQAAKITKEWAKRNDVPYHEMNYLDSLVDVTRHMANSWRLEPGTTVAHLQADETIPEASPA